MQGRKECLFFLFLPTPIHQCKKEGDKKRNANCKHKETNPNQKIPIRFILPDYHGYENKHKSKEERDKCFPHCLSFIYLATYQLYVDSKCIEER
jgi:hypothetical protein